VDRVGLDHLEGRMGFWMLVFLFILLSPVFVVAEIMSWFERKR